MDFSLAYNSNETEVVSQKQVNGVDPVSESTVFNIENKAPGPSWFGGHCVACLGVAEAGDGRTA